MAYLGGMLSKELGVIAPAVIILSEVVCPQHRWLLRRRLPAVGAFAVYLMVSVLYFAMRSQAIVAKSIHEAFAGVTEEQRVFTGLRVCLEYVAMLLFPVRFSADYAVADTGLSLGLLEPGVAASVCVLLLAVVFLVNTIMLAMSYSGSRSKSLMQRIAGRGDAVPAQRQRRSQPATPTTQPGGVPTLPGTSLDGAPATVPPVQPAAVAVPPPAAEAVPIEAPAQPVPAAE